MCVPNTNIYKIKFVNTFVFIPHGACYCTTCECVCVFLLLFQAAWEKNLLIDSVIVFYFPREILDLFHFFTTLSLIFLDKSLFFSSSRHRALCFVYANKCQASLKELKEMPVIF